MHVIISIMTLNHKVKQFLKICKSLSIIMQSSQNHNKRLAASAVELLIGLISPKAAAALD